ncbi:hypothetical protein MLD38_032865 [Melastoma candidum]|uniref:Uncharacterized protein n=2 Tax=Melastoma candidum TaxID=119954 RepID=A0ACB9M523_9MYRT|nr:hypothetical protein MLD38_032865 [Melastoma candidum]
MLINASSSSAGQLPPIDPDNNLDLNSNFSATKKKRRPAGTPDPDAEVVALSPRTLLESDRYVCEICNQGFQRDQNLQMHRRRHKVPWKLLKREVGPDGTAAPPTRKRVFVCPEPTCLHHNPGHALGDLVGIKKHYRRKHSNNKQWVCDKCSKGYAVQSDYKAHLKTCGTRGHSCDCGKVFSRVESFIEHQDSCNMGRLVQTDQQQQQATTTLYNNHHHHHQQRQQQQQQPPQPCLSRTASSPSPSRDTNTLTGFLDPNDPNFRRNPSYNNLDDDNGGQDCSLELRLVTAPGVIASASVAETSVSSYSKRDLIESTTHLQLSIGSCDDHSNISTSGFNGNGGNAVNHINNGDSSRMRDEVKEQLRLAMEEKVSAEDARKAARRELEMAEKEFEDAKRMRQRAQIELDRALALKEHTAKEIDSAMLRITCYACKRQFQSRISGV